MSIASGTRLGPYEIVESLGAGGMGEVWRAKDTRLDREVAIKVLPEGLAQNEQFLQRFEREARTISSLNHPHICTLYDVGEVSLREGEAPAAPGREAAVSSGDRERGSAGASPSRSGATRYLVMELIEGESLADRLKKGPLPLHEVLKYGRQIASALDAAHKRNVIHRDLKPGNIMLTRSGAKLLDFGLAKSATEGGGIVEGMTSLPTEAKPLTQEGTILGTFQYMAPEQLEGIEADARTDIFALGAVIYEMATSRRAFQGDSKTSLIASIVSSQPAPISSITPMTPPALDHVVRKCLEKDPDDRWQSAHDIASELQWISEAGSQAGVATPITMRRKNRERLAWTIAGVLLVTLIALAAAWFPRPAESEKAVIATIPPPRGTSLIPFDLLGLTLSPDGERLAFVANEKGGQRRVWLRDLSSAEATPVSGTEEASYPFWSPDGEYLGFFAQGKLKRVDLRGGAPQILADAPSGRGASWGRNDLILYAPNIRTSIFSIPASGGTPKEITRYDPETETTHRWPVLLPDGTHFLYVSRQIVGGSDKLGRLMLASVDGGEPRVLINDATNALYVPGYLLFGKGSSLFAQPFDPDALELGGRAIPIVDRDVSFWEPKNFDVFTASDDGTIIYLPSAARTSTLELFDRTGRPLGAIGEPAYQRAAVLSPDGTRLAVVRGGSAEGPFDLWIHDFEYDRASRVTFGGEPFGNPVWSPDGKRIAFSCSPRGVGDVCVKDLETPGEVEELIVSPNWTVPGSWSPDGMRFYYHEQDPETNEDIHVADLENAERSGVILRTPFIEAVPEVSPEGEWLAYVSLETGAPEVFLRAASGAPGQWQVSRSGGADPRWTENGRQIYFRSDDKLMVVQVESVRPLRIGDPRVLFELPGEPYRDEPVFQDVSGDGERVLLNVPTDSRSSIGLRMILNWTAMLPEDP